MQMILFRLVAPLAVTALVAGGVMAVGLPGRDGTQVSFLFPNAANVIAGGDVELDGLEAGSVNDVALRDGRALVTVELDRTEPLTVGTTAAIEYRALLGERVVQIFPGPDDADPLPNGAIIDGNIPRIELDAVLNALTPEVREDLQGLLAQLATTLDGREQDLQATLQEAGPALEALGEVLASVGRDGDALQALVSQTAELSSRVADQHADTSQVIDGLETSMAALAQRDDELAAVLEELPATLDQVGGTLAALDPTIDEILPVVQDLQPVARRLPGVADSLSPVLRDLRPAVAELRALLPVADDLLQVTPGLLDDAEATLPGVDDALEGALPAVDFLRPYTPELTGWMTNWAGAWSSYDSNGRFARIWGNEGPGSFLDMPTDMPGMPGLHSQGNRAPGQLVGQPWTDANGSAMR